MLAGAALMVVGIATTAWVKRDQLFPELINVDEGIAAVEPPSLDGQASAAATRSAKSATTDRLTANQEAIANAALAQAQEIAETATTELSGTTNPAAPSDSDNLGVAANAAGAALQNSEAQSAVESLELTKAEDGAQAEADNAGGLPTPPSGDAEQEAEHVSSKGSLQDHLRRARAHLRNKLPEKAWLEVEEALSLGLDHPTTLETAAKVQYERREFPAARRYAEKCLLHDSKRMGCWLALADISERLDDLSTAADAWRTVLELDPRGRHAKRARKEAERLEATLADGSATRN